jgi:protein TonB
MSADTLAWLRERPLASAILVSIGIHAMALTLFPQLRTLKTDPPLALQVDILTSSREEARAPQAAVAEPQSQPRPAAPSPPPDRPRPKTPRPQPEMAVRQASPVAARPPPAEKEVLTATPDAPSPATQFSMPAASGPSESAPPLREPETAVAPDPDLLAGYGNALSQAIGRHQRYPRIAQIRGWQGTATVALKFGTGHRFLSATLLRSSGHGVLDEQALEMVSNAQPLPQPPETLRKREFTVMVPVYFNLRD